MLVTGRGPVLAASASSTGSIPNCPPGTSATLQLDCVIASWVDPAHYGSAIQASLTGALTRTWIKASPSTGYAHWIYTGRVRIHSRLKICPQPVPLGAIPCPEAGSQVGILWYKASARTAAPAPSGFSTHSITCNAQATLSVVTFGVYPELIDGTLQMIWTVTVTQLTKNPANDLGQAGVEFPVSIRVARVKVPYALPAQRRPRRVTLSLCSGPRSRRHPLFDRAVTNNLDAPRAGLIEIPD